tara:strand:- start:379 stop:1224 length:846 start_codon:yes stop_codon:yes gene_type:complete
MALLQDRVVSPDPFIWIKDQALPVDFCNAAIERFQNDTRVSQGRCGTDGTVKNIKKSNDLCISNQEDWDDISQVFYESLGSALKEYLAHIHSHYALECYDDNSFFDWAEFTCTKGDGLIDKGYQIQETEPYNNYDWHDDAMINWERQEERTLTYIWYLNNIYENGETEFMNGLKVPPRAGRLLIFPSCWTYMHRGRRLYGHYNKYICTGWVCRTGDYFDTGTPEQLPASTGLPIIDPKNINGDLSELEEFAEDKVDDMEEFLLDYQPPSNGELTLDETVLQ